jgi:predicted transcriptional regulator
MFSRILQLLSIGCSHRRLSQAFTAAAPPSSAAASWEAVQVQPEHYVVCLDCGKKFSYDWQNMRVVW